MRSITLAFMVLTGTFALVSQVDDNSKPDDATIKQAVLAVHTQMAQAEEVLDDEAFFKAIPDFDTGLIIQDGVLFQTRQEALEAVSTGFQGVLKVVRTYNQKYVTVISPETALLTGSGTSSVTLIDGRTLTGPFAVSMVFVLHDGHWQMLQGHYSNPNPR